MADQYKLSRYFPIQHVAEDCLVNGNMDLTIGFKLLLPEIFSMGENEYEQLHHSLVGVLSRLPRRTAVHYQYFCYQDSFKEKYEGNSAIQRTNYDYFFQRPVLYSYANLYITFQNKPQNAGFGNSPLMRPLGSKKEIKNIEAAIASYRKYINPILNDLNSINHIAVKRMAESELMCALHDYFAVSYDRPLLNSKEALRFLPDWDFSDKEGYMKIGNQYAGVVTMMQEGRELYSSIRGGKSSYESSRVSMRMPTNNLPVSFSYLLSMGLPYNHIVNVGIEILDEAEVEEQLSGAGAIGSNILSSLRIRSAVVQQEETEAYLDALTREHYRPARVKVNVIVNDTELASLTEKVNHVKNTFNSLNGTIALVENTHTMNLFLSSCPGGMKFLYRRPMWSTVNQAVCYFPKEYHYLTDREGIFMVDRFGKPCIVNFWSNPNIVNKNAVVFGPSRSGKSVALNHITSQLINYISANQFESGHHVIIIDVGGSYKKNCEFHEGYYFDSCVAENLRFNIFICAKDKEGNYLYKGEDDDKVNYVYAVLAKLWRGNETVKSDEKNILKDIIREFYEHVNAEKIFPDIIEFHKFLPVYESKMNREYRSMFSISSLKLALAAYTDGEHKYLLNAKDNLDLRDKSYIVFDLAGVISNSELLNIVMTIVVGIAVDKVENTHGVRKTIMIDEAIDFLKGDSAEFVGGAFRKVAKRNGQIIIATQGIKYLDDIDPLTRNSILGNCDIKILLNHSTAKESYPALQKNLGLTDFDLELLDSLQNGARYREIFMKFGDAPRVYRVEFSPFAEGVYTSTKTELEEIKKYQDQMGHLGAAINQFVLNKYHAKTMSNEKV